MNYTSRTYRHYAESETRVRDTFMAPALHESGLLNSIDFLKMAPRQRTRFLVRAMKRARSKHPHNAKWACLLGPYTAWQVSTKLEST